MKSFISKFSPAAVAILLAMFVFLPGAADAQTVTRQPFLAATNSWTDLGNGTLELLALEGSAVAYTSSGSGVGSGSTTSITLTATPLVPPCIGCSISGGTLTTSSHVTAFNGTTTITTDTSQTVAASTPLSWGAACPTSGIPPAPSAANNSLSAPLNLRASTYPSALAMPLYSLARICLYGGQQAGGTVVSFPIAAH